MAASGEALPHPPGRQAAAGEETPEEARPGPAVAGGTGRARLRTGSLFFATSQLAGMALSFLGSMVLVRIADKPAVASYTLLLQAILAVGLVLQLGLGAAALRFVPISRGRGGDRNTAVLRRRLFILQVGSWSCAIPLLALTWPWITRAMNAPELARATPFVLAAAMLASFGHLVDNYFRAFRFYAVSAALTHFLPRALIFAGFAALWLAGGGTLPWEVLASIYLGSLLVTGLSYAAALPWTTAAETSEPRDATPPPGFREILGTSTAMGLRSAASVLYLSSSLWILKWARPHEEVAIYAVAASLLQVLSAIPAATTYVIPQEFAVLWADRRVRQMETLARTSATVVAGVSLTALAGLALAGKPLIRFAYPEYGAAWGLLLILGLGSFWDTASGGAGYVLQMTGRHLRLLGITLGGAALNVALSLALAPRWGAYGIALATTVTLIAVNIAMVESVRRLFGVRTFVYGRVSQWREVLRLVLERRRKR
jgi:O-antigen/teichoic acid export membrane protein